MDLLPFLPWLAAWSATSLLVLVAALVVARPWRLGRVHLDVLATGILWLALTTLLVQVAGLAGLLARGPFLVLTLLGWMAVFWAARRGRLDAELDALARVAGAARRSLLSTIRRPSTLIRHLREHPIDALFAVAVLFVAARLMVHVLLLPPYLWDGLSYHLPNVVEWLQNGRLVIFPTPVDRAFYPANFELFQTYCVLFLHHDVLVDAAGIPFYLLSAAAVFSLARLLHLPPRTAFLAALAYALTPAVLTHATSGNNDLPIALVFLFLVALSADYRERRDLLFVRLAWGAVALALAVGTKLTIVFLAPGLVVLAAWATRGAAPATRNARPDLGATSLVVGALGLSLLAGYWYLRNVLVFGNPIYPAGLSLFGHHLLEAGRGAAHEQQGAIGFGAMVENFRLLLGGKILDAGEEFSYSLKDMTGWGWLVFVCGWPALGIRLLRSSTLRWWTAAFVLSLAGLFFCVTPDPWNLRFALWLPALPVLAFAAVLDRLPRSTPRRAWGALAALCLTLNLVGTLDIGRLPPWMWSRMASFPLAERSTAALGLYIGRSYFDLLAAVPEDEPVAYNVNYNGWIYPLYGAGLDRRIHYLPIGPTTDVAAALRELGVRRLFVALPPPEARAGIARALAAGDLQQVGEGHYVLRDP